MSEEPIPATGLSWILISMYLSLSELGKGPPDSTDLCGSRVDVRAPDSKIHEGLLNRFAGLICFWRIDKSHYVVIVLEEHSSKSTGTDWEIDSYASSGIPSLNNGSVARRSAGSLKVAEFDKHVNLGISGGGAEI